MSTEEGSDRVQRWLQTIESSLDFTLRDEKKLEESEQRYGMRWLKFYKEYIVALWKMDFRATMMVEIPAREAPTKLWARHSVGLPDFRVEQKKQTNKQRKIIWRKISIWKLFFHYNCMFNEGRQLACCVFIVSPLLDMCRYSIDIW